VIVFPSSKINIGLRILKKRNDGYHDLETIFYPLNFNDVLEIVEYKGTARSSTIPFTMSGLKIEGPIKNNLCIKAYKLLKKNYPSLPHIQMHLHKVVPSRAGLGGGSADAAYTLKLLNEKFKLRMTTEQLMNYALELGSDCPFFILNAPCYATGRGEITEPIALDLSNYKIAIVNPGISINTGKAFLQIRPSEPRQTLKDIVKIPIERWKDHIYNDFEKIAFLQYPEIVEIKDQLYTSGALYASMSGSGSTMYGIFPKKASLKLKLPVHYFIKELNG
jgi:4-diphosphocytidyl-2-C-methyl-D-erythritol kinase